MSVQITKMNEYILLLCSSISNNSNIASEILKEILYFCQSAIPLLKALPNCIYVDDAKKAIIVGDIHGALVLGEIAKLIRAIIDGEVMETIDFNIIFLGDYVDRGPRSLETFLLLMLVFMKYPSNVFPLRGNHECISISTVYGLSAEIYEKILERDYAKVNQVNEFHQMFGNLFKVLPLCAIRGKIFFCHGGLPFYASTDADGKQIFISLTISQINEIKRDEVNIDVQYTPENHFDQAVIQILWGDPTSEPECCYSDRGIGYKYGKKIINDFLLLNGLDRIIRAHEVPQEGIHHDVISDEGKPLVSTLFSSPDYRWGNSAAVIYLAENSSDELVMKYEVSDKILEEYSKLGLPQDIAPTRASSLQRDEVVECCCLNESDSVTVFTHCSPLNEGAIAVVIGLNEDESIVSEKP